jgi:membrane-anchored glycerophosphoryl diester phosphodiesterase (GDPDase)
VIYNDCSIKAAVAKSWRIARGNRFGIVSLEVIGSIIGSVALLLGMLAVGVGTLLLGLLPIPSLLVQFAGAGGLLFILGLMISIRILYYTSGFIQLSGEESGLFEKKSYTTRSERNEI